MEEFTLYALVVSAISLMSYCSLKVFYSIWWRPKWLEKHLEQQGIRGNPHKPLLGDMKEYIKLITEAWSKPMSLDHQIVPRVDPFTRSIVENYGKISLCWAGKTPRLIITDINMVKEVLSNKQGHIQKPPINPLILILTRGLTTLEGEKWATHRRILKPAFHLAKLKSMVPVFVSSCRSIIERWKKAIGDSEIDVSPEFQELAGDIISQAGFGTTYEEGKKIFELQKELQTLVVETMQTLYIPGLRFVPTKKNRRRRELDRNITSMLRALVERREETIKKGQANDDNLLDLLLKSATNPNDSINDSKGDRMTVDELIEECKQFYLAGHETTSSLLTWTIVVLAMHPDWQEKARDEVRQLCQGKDPDFEVISRMKIVNMILYEVLRLYPPVIALYQYTYKDTKIGNLNVKKGVDLTLPILLINRDSDIWGDDADKFKPERFSEGVLKACNDQAAFIPFGWGPRTCIGQNFAMLEAKVALAMILMNFSFELSASYAHAPYTVMTLQPQHGAQIKFTQL